jgi:hypothetical protein
MNSPLETYEEFLRLMRSAEGEIENLLSDISSMDDWPPGHEQYWEMNKEKIAQRLVWIKEDFVAAANFWRESGVEGAMASFCYGSSTIELAEERPAWGLSRVAQAERELPSLSDEGARELIKRIFQ